MGFNKGHKENKMGNFKKVEEEFFKRKIAEGRKVCFEETFESSVKEIRKTYLLFALSPF